MIRIFTLSLLCLLILSCETEEIYELATSDKDFIELQIGDETYLLNARPALSRTYFLDNDRDVLRVERSTSDNLHALELNLESCELRKADLPKTVVTDAADCAGTYQTVEINYTTFAMNNDPVCPHLEGVPTELTGSVTIEEWTDDDYVTGTFSADPMDGTEHRLEGSFKVYAR